MGSKKVDVVYVVASKLGSIGIGTIAYNAMKQVDLKNISYTIFCRGYNSKIDLKRTNIESYGFLEYLSYPFRFLEKKMGFKINSFKFVNSIFGRLVYSKLPDCKIYHTWVGIAPDAIKKAEKNGCVLILEAANSHPLNASQIMNEEYKKYNLTDFLIKEKDIKEKVKIYNVFDYVMCPSDFVYDSFLKHGFSKKQLIKLPYGVSLKNLKKKKQKEDKFKAVFVGSLQLRKGIQYLLKAWEELNLKDAELILVGRVWPDAKNIVKKYKSNKSIKFVGFCPSPKKYLEKSSIFVFPSIEEGSALVNYEAMASSLPLITTFNSGSIARDKKEGFIIPIRDIKSLKNKILYFYNNPNEVKRMGENARKLVEKYSWENYGNKLVKEYKKILEIKNGKT